MLNSRNILITESKGKKGEALIQSILKHYSPKVLRIYSRDDTIQIHISKI